MSHVATIEIEITDLADLRAACEELNLEFMDGQQTYQWFGESVGDYPLPAGFEEHDLGRCTHAIRLNHQARIDACIVNGGGILPYEIGVVPRRDGKRGWTLLWDFFNGGYGLQDRIGENGGKLKQAVATAASIRTMAMQGFRHKRELLPNGTVKLQFQRG